MPEQVRSRPLQGYARLLRLVHLLLGAVLAIHVLLVGQHGHQRQALNN